MILGVESQGENIAADFCIGLVGGGLSGITAASVTYSLDHVSTRVAAQVIGIRLAFSFGLANSFGFEISLFAN